MINQMMMLRLPLLRESLCVKRSLTALGAQCLESEKIVLVLNEWKALISDILLGE